MHDLDYFRRGHLFNDTGKWKYDVWLDYNNVPYDNYDLWSEARKALKRATAANLSGVTIRKIPTGWSLIVPNPVGKYAHPIMVVGGDND